MEVFPLIYAQGFCIFHPSKPMLIQQAPEKGSAPASSKKMYTLSSNTRWKQK